MKSALQLCRELGQLMVLDRKKVTSARNAERKRSKKRVSDNPPKGPQPCDVVLETGNSQGRRGRGRRGSKNKSPRSTHHNPPTNEMKIFQAILNRWGNRPNRSNTKERKSV